ncbi:HIG1 domain family member 2A, mitochondrial [Pogona vitticeps]|uniref:HIG1 domain family member 2A, mitochondrial n=1 Tax=Pogona vitticeps TaxID=103695 RepID=A0A6J0TKM4_9SAUR|nr:HIG1 domain family member 2A, mitochondrial [Pogona vitticeps]
MDQGSPPSFDPNKPPVIEGFTPTSMHRTETFSEKFPRKFKENPFVPIGCLVTLGVLTYGFICFKRGDTRRSQLMMRARVVAQGLTLTAIVMGSLFTGMAAKK